MLVLTVRFEGLEIALWFLEQLQRFTPISFSLSGALLSCFFEKTLATLIHGNIKQIDRNATSILLSFFDCQLI